MITLYIGPECREILNESSPKAKYNLQQTAIIGEMTWRTEYRKVTEPT